MTDYFDDVIQVPNYGYMVESKSRPGSWWLVGPKGCPCEARIARCRHARRVADLVASKNAEYARPTAPYNPAVFCD